MGAKSKTDWGLIKHAYLAEYAATGTCNLKKLAKKFNVVYGTLRNKASAQKWATPGKVLEEKAAEQVEAQILPKIVSKRVAVMNTHLEYVEFIKKKAMKSLVDAKELSPTVAAKLVFDAMTLERRLVDDVAASSPAEARLTTHEMFENFMKQFMPGSELAAA